MSDEPGQNPMSDDEADRRATQVAAIVERIRPILAGNQPEVQGGALADLFSMFIAGHFDADGRTAELREAMITEWLITVRQLIPVNEAMILENTRRGSN
jgi:hypothetical protein